MAQVTSMTPRARLYTAAFVMEDDTDYTPTSQTSGLQVEHERPSLVRRQLH